MTRTGSDGKHYQAHREPVSDDDDAPSAATMGNSQPDIRIGGDGKQYLAHPKPVGGPEPAPVEAITPRRRGDPPSGKYPPGTGKIETSLSSCGKQTIKIKIRPEIPLRNQTHHAPQRAKARVSQVLG